MKTRDAFALRGVEENFSFQSMIGKMLTKCGLSATALQKLDADRDDFDDMQRARQAYQNLDDELKDFRRRIIRHNDRLLKFGMMTLKSESDNKPRDKRLVNLSDKYTAIAKKLIEAEETVNAIIYNIDCYQRQYCIKIFAERLKETRKRLKFTQAAFAKFFGISQRGYANYERCAAEPSPYMLKILARLSDRPIDWFLGE